MARMSARKSSGTVTDLLVPAPIDAGARMDEPVGDVRHEDASRTGLGASGALPKAGRGLSDSARATISGASP